MTINKRKKNSRLRGSHTHGYGSKKKHRGAGSRGGKGMAGTGKRGDAKKPSIWTNPKYFGKFGFKLLSHKANTDLAINLNSIQDSLMFWVKEGKVKENNGSYEIDLTAMKYDKLLGYGIVKNKLNIKVGKASASAVEKVVAAGGQVEVKQ